MKLTRTERRQMKKLAPHVERVADTDRVFFEQHPDRKHRVRLASEVEIAQLEIMNREVMSLPPGKRHFAIVRNVAPGTRMWVIATGPEDEGTDVEEAFAHALFDENASRLVRNIEAIPVASSKKGGAA